MYAAQSALAALLRSCRTGDGATIDVAMLDTTVEWMGHALYTQMPTGAQPPRMGLSHSSIAPYRRVQHRTIAGPYDPHRHPLHPRRR
jgi:crotonobetainyl-CoA:carnitine CoA-transferase CaiB-like acyl-CoA transferase